MYEDWKKFGDFKIFLKILEKEQKKKRQSPKVRVLPFYFYVLVLQKH
jgi:hypothetical protein